MVFQNQTNQLTPHDWNWVNQLYNYESFARCIMIKRYVEDSVDLRNIEFKENVMCRYAKINKLSQSSDIPT